MGYYFAETSKGDYGYLLASTRNGFDPTSRGVGEGWILNTGFRVSEIPEPATLSLLASGGVALLRRRR